MHAKAWVSESEAGAWHFYSRAVCLRLDISLSIQTSNAVLSTRWMPSPFTECGTARSFLSFFLRQVCLPVGVRPFLPGWILDVCEHSAVHSEAPGNFPHGRELSATERGIPGSSLLKDEGTNGGCCTEPCACLVSKLLVSFWFPLNTTQTRVPPHDHCSGRGVNFCDFQLLSLASLRGDELLARCEEVRAGCPGDGHVLCSLCHPHTEAGFRFDIFDDVICMFRSEHVFLIDFQLQVCAQARSSRLVGYGGGGRSFSAGPGAVQH